MAMTLTPNAIARLFQQILLGRVVTAEKIPPFRLSPADPSVTATYSTGQEDVAGVCIADLDLTHRAGAALCLIPADSRLRAAKLDVGLVDNFKEILNICAQLFAGADLRRVSLSSVAFSSDARPPAVAALIAAPLWRLDVKLSIADYGSGRISLLSNHEL
jgi:hypothetical protein